MSDRKIQQSSDANFPRTIAILAARLQVLELGLQDTRTTPWQRAFLRDESWEAAVLLGMLRSPGAQTVTIPEDF